MNINIDPPINGFNVVGKIDFSENVGGFWLFMR